MSKDIGALIREMRKSSGMSQMKLADRIGVSYQQVQKYEKGASKLSVPRLIQIAEVFSVPPITFINATKSEVKVAEKSAAYSNMTDDEVKLLMLYRRLGRKKLKEGFVEMLRDLVRMGEGK